MVVTRLDEGMGPLWIEAQDVPPDLAIDRVMVPSGRTQTEVTVTSARNVSARIVLVGWVEGRVAGRSQPIRIEPAGEASREVANVEN